MSEPTNVLSREVLSYSPDVVLLIDDEGMIVQAGGQLTDLLEVGPDEVEGRPLRELVLPRDLYLLPDDVADLVGWERRMRHPLEVHLRHGSGAGDEAEGGEMAGGKGQQADRWRLFSVSIRDLRDEPEVGLILLSLQPVGQPGVWDVSRSLLLQAVEAANSCIVIADLKQKDQPLVYANEGFRRLTGYENEEVLGRNCRFLQRRDDGSRDEDQEGVPHIREAVDAGKHVTATIRNYRADGEMFYNELFLTPVRQEGELVAYIGVQNDVTARVIAQKESAQREEALRSLFEATPMLMGVVELEDHQESRDSVDAWLRATHVMLNEPAAEALGLNSSRLDAATVEACGGGDRVARRMAEAFAAAVATGKPERFVLKVSPERGELAGKARRFRVVVNVVRPGDGEPPRCSYIADDVTEAAEGEEQRKLLQAAVVNVRDGILITEADLDEPGPRIQYVNDAFCEMTGYERDELIGQTPRLFQGEKTDSAVLARLRRDLAAGRPFFGEAVNYRKDGTPYYTAWNIAPVRDDAGTVTHWVSAQRDMTRRRQLERQVLDVQETEQARIARDLHDTVAQSLNTLSLYVGGVRRELEQSGIATADQIEQLVEATEQARNAAEQARNLSHSLTPVDVEQGGLVLALERLARRSQIAYGIACEVNAKAFSQPIADRETATHLFRIASEAISNAMRHADAARVSMRLFVEGNAGKLQIADDGTGMPSHLRVNVGELMASSRFEGTELAAGEGRSGLGISTMAYRSTIIGGNLKVNLGDGPSDRPGTVITVTFPVESA